MQESETLRKDGGALSNKRPPRILGLTTTAAYAIASSIPYK